MDKSVTIIADASFCHQTKLGGYGAWVASSIGKQQFSGLLDKPKDNNTAEIMAISNALWHGFNSGIILEGFEILIQTDSRSAMQMYEGDISPKNNQQVKAKDYVQSLINRYKIKVRYKHVKGHTDRDENRYKAQHHCDQAARYHMLKAKSELLNTSDEFSIDCQKNRMMKKSGYLRMRVR